MRQIYEASPYTCFRYLIARISFDLQFNENSEVALSNWQAVIKCLENDSVRMTEFANSLLEKYTDIPLETAGNSLDVRVYLDASTLQIWLQIVADFTKEELAYFMLMNGDKEKRYHA